MPRAPGLIEMTERARRGSGHPARAFKIVAVPLTLPNPPAAGRIVPHLANRRERSIPTAKAELCPRYDGPAALRLWHLSSLDAPSVAAVWSLGFAWIARLRLPLWVLALQLLVVWAVYVGDRLLDARAGLRRGSRSLPNELRERHFFHWRHRRVLAPIAVVAACTAAAIALRRMPVAAGERDSLLAAASLAYFTRVHSGPVTGEARQVFSKELLVGVLFTVGCALPAWSPGAGRALCLPVVFFAALAWLNCRAIEYWESGRAGIARVAGWVVLAGIVAAASLATAQPRAAAWMAAGAASALLLGALDRVRGRMTAVTLRAAADLVLLAPALLLAIWLVRR